MHAGKGNAADIAARAQRLLTEHFTGMTADRRQHVLDDAFRGLQHDPRPDLGEADSAVAFASLCVTRLLAFGCTDGHRHALSRLLITIRDAKGTHPPADYIDLPPLLDALCALPRREEERVHLKALLADCRAKAAKYASLRAVARCAGTGPAEADLDDPDDIALLRHLRRRSRTGAVPKAETRDYRHVLDAFAQVPRAALLGQPGAGKSTTLRRLAADRASVALEDPAAPLPVLVNLGAWTGAEPFVDFLARQAPQHRRHCPGPGPGRAPDPAPGRPQRDPQRPARGQGRGHPCLPQGAAPRDPGGGLLPRRRLCRRPGPGARHPDPATPDPPAGARGPGPLAEARRPGPGRGPGP